MKQRIEKDSIGEILVDSDKLWGAQTQRSFENFKIGTEKMPVEIIRAITIIKRAAAVVNFSMGNMSEEISQSVTAACDKILAGGLDDQFPLSVWQTGSGTQTNMNVNEVISHLTEGRAHPNDHVNMSQSSNDVFPSAIHIACVIEAEDRLLPEIKAFADTFGELSDRYRQVIKTGRTHLQDATPLTFGQEFAGWQYAMEKSYTAIKNSLTELKNIPIGGTAVGTGLNAPKGFDTAMAAEISELTGRDFKASGDKFYGLAFKDAAAVCHSAMKALACNLMKIANDVRWYASGPRCGIGELIIPANEPGSSIMPGKVNPTQCEALTMVCAEVMGNDVTVGIAASQGNFQLNVYMPLIAFNMIRSIRLLSDAVNSFNINCAKGITVNEDKVADNMADSLMLVTALNKVIGYDKAAQIAKYAYSSNTSLEEAATALGILTKEEFREYVDPEKMVGEL